MSEPQSTKKDIGMKWLSDVLDRQLPMEPSHFKDALCDAILESNWFRDRLARAWDMGCEAYSMGTENPYRPATPGLTEAEQEVARRWFAGEATEVELSETVRAHVSRIARVTAPEGGESA